MTVMDETGRAAQDASPVPARLRATDCRVDDFVALLAQTTHLADYPLAQGVEQNVLVYDGATLRREAATTQGREAVQAELVRALSVGPGVAVFKGAFTDPSVVDRTSAVFDAIIEDERADGGPTGDHFAAAGANSRVWNALEKLAVRDPEAFVDYYANDILALVSDAWLGPGYQMTSQVNVVRPGGKAQDPHRDYHLGFLGDEMVERYPTHVHQLSPVLTLQGAVAHSDMPVESGPTLYLPYSHQYLPGYLAWRRPEFRAYFEEHYVQLPLRKGDAAFFNPALFHGAGSNVSADLQRTANLLQVSSAFGRAMESVDRARMSALLYPALRQRYVDPADRDGVVHAIAASAEGYPFPTSLDLDQPTDRLTPQTQAELLARALAEDWDPEKVSQALINHTKRRSTEALHAS